MRTGRPSRLMAVLLAGAVLIGGCGAQAPSDQPAVDTLVRFYDLAQRCLADHRVVEQRERVDRADQLHDPLG